MQTTSLKRIYLCESRAGSLNRSDLTVSPGHEAHLCDYCYRWHAVPQHTDDAQVMRFATSMVRFADIIGVAPVRAA